MKRLLPLLLTLVLPSGARPQSAAIMAVRDTVARTADQGARRRLLEAAVREHPADAWAHYTLALALAAAGEAPSAGRPAFRREPGDESWNELQRALAADSSYAPAAVALAEIALCGTNAARLDAARRALARAGAPAVSPAAALAGAEVSLRLGDVAAATDAARAALGDPVEGPAALRVMGIAFMRLPGSAADGASDYLEGAARGGAAAPAYYRDAAPIASAAESEAWRRATTDSERTAWIGGFWSRRAGAAGIPTADRLAEHFHRLAVADRDYRLRWAPSLRFAAGNGDMDPDVPYDDRGLAYLRYGTPDQVERRGEVRVWVYWRTGGAPLRFFLAGSRFADVIPLNIRSSGPRVALGSPPTPFDGAIDLLQDLSAGDKELTQLRGRLMQARQLFQVPRAPSCGRRQCAPSAMPDAPDSSAVSYAAGDLTSYQAELSAIVRRRLAVALASEDARPTVDRALPFFYDLATFRGPAGMTDVVASLAIPGEQVPAFEYPDGRLLYAPRVQVAIASPGAPRVAFADSAFRRWAPRRLAPGEFLRLAVPLVADPAPLASHRVGVTVLTDSVVGQVYGGITVIPDYSSDRLMLSDIVLAEGGEGGTWRRGEVSLSFMPAQHFPARGAVKLFYEIYHLPAGSAYHTQIAIQRDRNGVWEAVQGLFSDNPGLTLDFDGRAPPDAAGTVQEVRIIRPNLKPGKYRILITVTSQARGEEASSERRFDLLP